MDGVKRPVSTYSLLIQELKSRIEPRQKQGLLDIVNLEYTGFTSLARGNDNVIGVAACFSNIFLEFDCTITNRAVAVGYSNGSEECRSFYWIKITPLRNPL